MSTQTVDAVVETLKEIEGVSPSKEHYSGLCLLLTLNKLSDHPEYRNWNPSKGRINCFKEVLPLVEDLLGGNSTGDKKSPTSGESMLHERSYSYNESVTILFKYVISYKSSRQLKHLHF